MSDHKIQNLLSRLNLVLSKQAAIQSEVATLQEEILQLQSIEDKTEIAQNEDITQIKEEGLEEKTIPTQEEEIAPISSEILEEEKLEAEKELVMANDAQDIILQKTTTPQPKPKTKEIKKPIDLEKFIGENLANKIGIFITVIGVGIGAKYAIDNDMISPLTRIIFGYLMGLGLLGTAFKLKVKYEKFSAVLLSGAIAILYFITFFAYDFYGLIPLAVAFPMMVLVTAFSVFAAIQYNRQIIAILGLVGAYAVPFLLSSGSGRVDIMFWYMSLINIGVLIVAVQKYWKLLYYSAFFATWLIYFSWFVPEVVFDGNDYKLAFSFASIFFAIFYLTFLSYKLIKKEVFQRKDILIMFLNSAIFYGIGFLILDSGATTKHLLGLFTLVNALIHFLVSVFVFKNKSADRKLFYFTSGLVLTFLTLAIPVQLDGNWVTLFWAAEAALLFWLGRTKKIVTYERLSYPLMILAGASLMQDWETIYAPRYGQFTILKPFLNVHLLSSLIFAGIFAFINFINQKKEYPSLLGQTKFDSLLHLVRTFAIPSLLFMAVYLGFFQEINHYFLQFDMTFHRSNVLSRKTIWLINYSMVFATILTAINLFKTKNKNVSIFNLAFNSLLIFVFLSAGLFAISEIRNWQQAQAIKKVISHPNGIGMQHTLLRYLSLTLFGTLLYFTYDNTKRIFHKKESYNLIQPILYGILLWILSSELLHWMDIFAVGNSYKLALSILWGSYALLLIVLGIWQKNKYIRLSAMALFALTILKLFAYDLENLNTISKTIAFISLGVLLLISSFLYNKYKHLIGEQKEDLNETDNKTITDTIN